MRSLILLEVEHEEDISNLTALCESLKPSLFHDPYRVTILEWSVKVDIPDCFTLGP